MATQWQNVKLWCRAGAMDEGAAVGGIRIMREAGTSVRTASYLPEDTAVFCRFLAPRKVPYCRAFLHIIGCCESLLGSVYMHPIGQVSSDPGHDLMQRVPWPS